MLFFECTFDARYLYRFTKNAMVEEATKYLDKTEIEGFGGNLILYKRPDLDAVTWHYRAKIEGMKGYVRRSY